MNTASIITEYIYIMVSVHLEAILHHNHIPCQKRSIRQENCETPELSCRWSKSKRTNEIELIEEFYEELKQRKS